MTLIPYKCPACPDKHYYGRLVETASADPRERNARCPNCGRKLVPAPIAR